MSKRATSISAQALVQAGRYVEAEQQLLEICSGTAVDAESWFTLGVLKGMQGDAVGAENGFRHSLALNPEFVQAQFNLGVALRDQGRLDEASTQLERVVAKQPRHAEALNVLGYVYLCMDRNSDAETCFRAAVACNPAFTDALTNLGNVLSLNGRWAEAIGFHRRALAAAPARGDVAINLGNVLVAQGRFEEAIAAYRQAIEVNPDNIDAYIQLGSALNHFGRKEEARLTFREALKITPDHVEAKFFLAALGSGNSPKSAPLGYVAKLFDGYAETFDAELVGNLQYRIPSVLHKAVVAALAGRQELDVLDLGCGTGLCGVLFKPISRSMAGVDISPKMVAKSRLRGIYDELVVGDVVDSLRQREASLDVVLAADVFIYVGELDEVFEGSAKALRPSGLFAFSVEAPHVNEEGGCVLRNTGRYAHSEAYINRMMLSHGFVSLLIESVIIRMDGGQAINGMVYVLQRA